MSSLMVAVTHETVRAVVQALADGDVVLEMPEIDARSQAHVRYAPGYARQKITPLSSGPVPGAKDEVPYNAGMLAEFLGWMDTASEFKTLGPSPYFLTVPFSLWAPLISVGTAGDKITEL